MSIEISALFLIIAGMVYLFFTEKLPLDVTAMSGLLLLTFAGYLTPDEALSGFSSPVFITMVSIFVLSAALKETGVARKFAAVLHRRVGSNQALAIIGVVLVAAFLSSFMNRVAAAALLLPGVMGLAVRASIPPSLLLIPLSFGTIFGGMAMPLSTPANLLAQYSLEEAGLAPFSTLAFLPFGLVAMLLGAVFLAMLGPKLLPRNQIPKESATGQDLPQLYRLYERLFALRVPANSSLVGRTLESVGFGNALGALVLAITHGPRQRLAPRGIDRLAAGDTLIVAGRISDFEAVQKCADGQSPKVVVAGEERDFDGIKHLGEFEILSTNVESELDSLEVAVVEAVLSPRSSLIGRTIREIEFRERYGLQVLAIWRAGEPHRTRLGNRVLEFGDALLLQGPRDRVATLMRDADFVFLSESKTESRQRAKAPIAIAAFVIMVALAVFKIEPVEISALLAVTIVLVARVLPAEQAYREIEWRVSIFTAALLPLGIAFQKSGAAALISELVVAHAGQYGPMVVMAGLCVLASALSQALDGAPAMVLLSAITIQLAQSLGVSPYPFMMAVALSTSNAFLTPFSHKSNLLVMNPGGYRAKDYFRIGWILSLIMFIMVMLLVPILLPFKP
ncbi:MAG: SLC13 family permease [Deltaproteobacteria bacterium]|nr:SLC13 family permease [Deltaproteobacteria bacterium]